MLNTVYLLLGSNSGNRYENLRNAAKKIAAQAGTVLYCSPYYETPVWGEIPMDPFYNCALEMVTPLEEQDFLRELMEIELSMGRNEKERSGPRIIDIDILLFGDRIIDEENLKVPHPRMHLRRFALTPLNDIAPGVQHPLLEKPVSQLLEECTDDSWIKKVNA